MPVSAFELFLHVLLAIFAVTTLITAINVWLYVRRKMIGGAFRDTVLLLVASAFFSVFRWLGGSAARLQFGFMDSDLAISLWTLSGILAASLALLGFLKLNDFAKTYGFGGDKEK